MIKEYITERLSLKRRKQLRRFMLNILSIGKRGNLNKLGKLYETDKIGVHNYTTHYMTHFRKYRFKRIKLFEIGVGGHDNPMEGGKSLRMWKKYFPFGEIYGLDIYDKSAFREKRI
jgi:hypothetical protein